MFFLHLDPLEGRDLSARRGKRDFDELDLAFGDRRLVEGRGCVARRKLPAHGIAALRTGRFIVGEDEIRKGGFGPAMPAENGRTAP